MRPVRILLVAGVCAALLGPEIMFATAAAATAQTVPSAVPTAQLQPAPLPKSAPVFDVQLWPEPTSAAIIANVTVPTSTPLPVRMRIPLPAGATVDWVGEIVGELPEQDIPSPWRLTNGGKVVEMVLTTSRVAQYEATYLRPVQEGDMLVSRLEWVQSVPASSVRFAVRASAGIRDVAITPASPHAPQFNDSGERLYVLDPRKMNVGESASISATFRAGSEGAPDAAATTGPGSATVVAWLLAGLGVAVAGLLVVLRWQAGAARRR